MLGAILSLLVSGLIIGLLARFAVPGKDPLKLWQTILLGIAGSFLGGAVAGLLGVLDGDDTIEAGEAATSFLWNTQSTTCSGRRLFTCSSSAVPTPWF